MRKVRKNSEAEREEDIFEEKGTEDVITSLIDYYDEIDQLSDNRPDKKSKEYKNWLTLINRKIKEVNQMAGYKVYKSVI